MADPDPTVHVSDGGQPLTLEAALDLLTHGRIDIQGLLPYSINYTFLIIVTHHAVQAAAVYKPCRGERPLWDFPAGTLANREVAAHVVSQALGWWIVPPTVLRDGPHGHGMVQFYIHNDPEQHYFTFGSRYLEQIRKIALFDVLVNNADRKSGHCLLDDAGHVWAIDHGICFHEEPKLRTVIWDFAGQPIPKPLLRDVRRFRSRLGSQSDAAGRALRALLAPEESEALLDRVDRLISSGRFPSSGRGHHIPWPPI